MPRNDEGINLAGVVADPASRDVRVVLDEGGDPYLSAPTAPGGTLLRHAAK